MKKNYSYLSDTSFLKNLDNLHIKEQFVKITALDFYTENPMQDIQGKVISGNIEIQNSAIRRQGNLTMIVDDTTINITSLNNIISLNRKISIEVGYKNTTGYYKNYDIFWFPLGIYVITNPSISHTLDNFNISITFEDKMCLLNGSLGGNIPNPIDLMNYEYIDKNGMIQTKTLTIYQIILELVNHWGGEAFDNIIIEDLDTFTTMMIAWTNLDLDIYFYKDKDDEWHFNTYETDTEPPETKEDYSGEGQGYYGPYTYGDMIGLKYTDFTFPSETFECSAGESICNILERITQILGNYEFFYDLEGKFRFREKKNYLNTSESTSILNLINNQNYNEVYLIDRNQSSSIYTFENCKIVTSVTNSPQYNLIKNDYVIWGERKGVDSVSTPIRYHLAIDKIPQVGNIYKALIKEGDDGISVFGCPIIIQTLNDLYNISQDILELNSGFIYYVKEVDTLYKYNFETEQFEKVDDLLYKNIQTKDYRTELYLQGLSCVPAGLGYGTVSNYYTTELIANWNNMFQLKQISDDLYEDEWKPSVIENPYSLNYFLDIIDSPSELGQLNVSTIGRRTYAENNSNFNCVFSNENMNCIYFYTDEKTKAKGIKYGVPLMNFYEDDGFLEDNTKMFNNQNSLIDAVRDVLYQYTSYNNQISLSALPVYYLDVNSRITIRDTSSNIFGDYVISSISLPLGIDEDMSISASKAFKKI